MINSKKKGFTIVELVIVIAVIAVLAAVLIPTFSNLVKKANMSADQQAVRQMNTVLVMADSKKELETFNDAQLALAEAGYNALESLTPISTGYKFYWLNEHDCIVLADKDNKVVFPENLTDLDLGKAIAELNATNLKNAAEEIKAEVSDEKGLAEAIKKGQEITLTSDVVITSALVITSDTVINFADHKVSAPNVGRPFELTNGVTLTINAEETNKEIDCGQFGLVNILSGANANLIINGGSYVANTENGAFIKVRQGAGNVNITLNNVTYKDSSNNGFIVNKSGFSGTMNLNINGGSFEAFAGLQLDNGTIKDAIFKTSAMTFEVQGETTIINCTINTGSETVGSAPAAAVAVSSNGKAIVTGGTITAALTVYHVYSTGGSIIAKGVTVSEGYANLKKGLESGTITIE